MRRASVGDVVRFYGYEGTYTVQPYCRPRGSTLRSRIWAVPVGEQYEHGFPMTESSIVEVNGVAVPLLSCPIAPPARDYPHKPLFDYQDGPQERAAEAVALWERR